MIDRTVIQPISEARNEHATNPGGWNYRLVHVFSKEQDYDYYEVREVYYTDWMPAGIAVGYAAPGGDTVEEFLSSWRLYQSALAKPILVFDDDKDRFIGQENPIL
jgi:hypothetical protein